MKGNMSRLPVDDIPITETDLVIPGELDHDLVSEICSDHYTKNMSKSSATCQARVRAILIMLRISLMISIKQLQCIEFITNFKHTINHTKILQCLNHMNTILARPNRKVILRSIR